jgi:hypothetical protein
MFYYLSPCSRGVKQQLEGVHKPRLHYVICSPVTRPVTRGETVVAHEEFYVYEAYEKYLYSEIWELPCDLMAIYSIMRPVCEWRGWWTGSTPKHFNFCSIFPQHNIHTLSRLHRITSSKEPQIWRTHYEKYGCWNFVGLTSLTRSFLTVSCFT